MAGFELTLRRKVSHYIITYYLPSGMFVIVSWISFLVPPEIVPGRMTLLVTVFLVLVNIFNTITTNIPKAEGLTGKQKMKIIPIQLHCKYEIVIFLVFSHGSVSAVLQG